LCQVAYAKTESKLCKQKIIKKIYIMKIRKIILLTVLPFILFNCNPRKEAASIELQDLSTAEISRLSDEEYSSFAENKFESAQENPLSTFSIDVDTDSYSNFRRFINQGQLPPKDAIRTEEMVNYFKYDYPEPYGSDPVQISTEVGSSPWNPSYRLIKIGLKAKDIKTDHLPASNFVFLIDTSGSMEGPERLELVKSSLNLLVNNLRPSDRISIVTYSGEAGLLLPSTSGDEKREIKNAINSLSAGGSTAGGEGIELAYKIAEKNFIKSGNNRIILCTDGDFNVGPSSESELESLIEEKRKSGVYLSILGYGMGNYKDDKMQILAQKGNGNHAYIDNLQEANRVLVSEFSSTLYTVAKDVKIQVEFNPYKVQYYRLIGYETRLMNKEGFNDDSKDAGEMGAGHTVTAVYEVIPVGVKATNVPSVDNLKYQKTETFKKAEVYSNSPDLLTVKMRYKEPESDTSKKIEVSVIDDGRNETSTDFKFISAVVMYSQLIRNSNYKGESSYDDVIRLAKSSLGNDNLGYRSEFVRLVEITKGLQDN
jgi:Ca-activated chloride channel family protein